MQSVASSTQAEGADIGASLCTSRQGSPRRSGEGSSAAGSAASYCPAGGVFSQYLWQSRIGTAEEPPRVNGSASRLSSSASTFSTPAPASGACRQARFQLEPQAARQCPAADAPSGREPRRRNGPSSRRESGGPPQTRGTAGAAVLRLLETAFKGAQRCLLHNSECRCQHIPLPRAAADLRHFLDALYYEEVCFLFLRCCLAIMHTTVFIYSCFSEKPFETQATIALLLGLLSALTVFRVLCQYHIFRALTRLRWEWWQRSIRADLVKLLRSRLWQSQRILFLVSFAFYFVALDFGYYRGTPLNVETASAPVLIRYMSLVVLLFLSVLGPHILMLVVVFTSLVVCWCATAADIEQLLVEEPSSARRALPARLLQMMQEEHWTLPEGPRAQTSISNRKSGTSSSNRRCPGMAHQLDKHTRQQQAKRRRTISTQSTGMSDVDGEGTSRRSRAGKRPRGTEDSNEAQSRGDFTCAICLSDFHEGDVVRRLPCSHVFHSACITRWLSNRASCPLRCYINFFSGRLSQPPYGESRCLRMPGSQVLRRRRLRFRAPLRERHQRHVGHQRRTSTSSTAALAPTGARRKSSASPRTPGRTGRTGPTGTPGEHCAISNKFRKFHLR